jgi:hypothetical protein
VFHADKLRLAQALDGAFDGLALGTEVEPRRVDEDRDDL